MSPRLGDVSWFTVHLVPVTRCEPPDGARCYLEGGADMPATEAKRHALGNPGHVVLRETVARTRYVYLGDDDG